MPQFNFHNFLQRFRQISWSVEAMSFAGVIILVLLLLGALLAAGFVYYWYPYQADKPAPPITANKKVLDEARLQNLLTTLAARRAALQASTTIATPSAFR